MKKTILSIGLMCSGLLAATAVLADDQNTTTTVNFNYTAPTYTISIPKTVELTNNGSAITGTETVSIDSATLQYGQSLEVSLASKSDLMVNNVKDGEYTIKHGSTILNSGDSLLAYNPNFEDLTTTPKQATLDIEITGGVTALKLSGQHTATVTFDIHVDRPVVTQNDAAKSPVTATNQTVNFLSADDSTDSSQYRVMALDGNGHALIMMDGAYIGSGTFANASTALQTWWQNHLNTTPTANTPNPELALPVSLPQQTPTLSDQGETTLTTYATSANTYAFIPSLADLNANGSAGTNGTIAVSGLNIKDNKFAWLNFTEDNGYDALTTGGHLMGLIDNANDCAYYPAFWVNI
jgi:hypothetical protein